MTSDLLLTGRMVEVVVAIVVELFLLLVTAELLVEVLGAVVEFVSMEMVASMIVKLLCPSPNEKRESMDKETRFVIIYSNIQEVNIRQRT